MECSVRLQRNAEITHMHRRHPDKVYVAVNSTVIEPVGVRGRYLLVAPRAVHLQDNAVVVLQIFRYVKKARCGASAVHADILPVQEHTAEIIRRADAQYHALSLVFAGIDELPREHHASVV